MEFVYTVPREELFPDFYPQGLTTFAGPRTSCAAKGNSASGAQGTYVDWLERVAQSGFFVERAHAERTPSLKQVIPYAIVTRGDEILLLRRTRAGGERRLHEKLSIGVGGHVEPVDLDAALLGDGPLGDGLLGDGPLGDGLLGDGLLGDGLLGDGPLGDGTHARAAAIEAAARRELHEELILEGQPSLQPLGLLNDDSNPVGAVHVGLVLWAQVEGDVRVRERDLLEGRLVSSDELKRLLQDGANFESWSALLVRAIDELLPRPAASLS